MRSNDSDLNPSLPFSLDCYCRVDRIYISHEVNFLRCVPFCTLRITHFLVNNNEQRHPE